MVLLTSALPTEPFALCPLDTCLITIAIKQEYASLKSSEHKREKIHGERRETRAFYPYASGALGKQGLCEDHVC